MPTIHVALAQKIIGSFEVKVFLDKLDAKDFTSRCLYWHEGIESWKPTLIIDRANFEQSLRVPANSESPTSVPPPVPPFKEASGVDPTRPLGNKPLLRYALGIGLVALSIAGVIHSFGATAILLIPAWKLFRNDRW